MTEELIPSARAVFARQLRDAIKTQGLTYKETARRAREYLPPDARLSATSVWHYANGKTFPRRLSYIKALSRVLGIEADEVPRQERSVGRAVPPAPGRGGSQVRVEDRKNGRARLIIDVEIHWPTALKILALLQEQEEPPAPQQQP